MVNLPLICHLLRSPTKPALIPTCQQANPINCRCPIAGPEFRPSGGGGSSSGRDLSMAPPISPVGLLRGGPGTIWQRRQTRTHSPDVLSTPPTPGIPESTCQINLPWIPGPGHTQSKLNFTRLSSKGSLTTGKVICCAKPELESSS